MRRVPDQEFCHDARPFCLNGCPLGATRRGVTRRGKHIRPPRATSDFEFEGRGHGAGRPSVTGQAPPSCELRLDALPSVTPHICSPGCSSRCCSLAGVVSGCCCSRAFCSLIVKFCKLRCEHHITG